MQSLHLVHIAHPLCVFATHPSVYVDDGCWWLWSVVVMIVCGARSVLYRVCIVTVVYCVCIDEGGWGVNHGMCVCVCCATCRGVVLVGVGIGVLAHKGVWGYKCE